MPTKTRRASAEHAPNLSTDVTMIRERPQLLALLFCDWANITTEGKHNLIGVFDALTLPTGETRTPVFTLFIRTANVYDAPIRVQLLDPDDTLVLEGTLTPEDAQSLADRSKHIQLIVKLQFEPHKSGIHWFEVLYGEHSLGGAGMNITLPLSEEPESNADST